MTTTLHKELIAVALCGFTVIGCDRPRDAEIVGGQSEEFAAAGTTRCAVVDEQVVCASSRMREPIQQASFSAL